MSVRLLLAAFAIVGVTAFAPAPFPKPGKKAPATSTSLDGTWTLLSLNKGGPGAGPKATGMKARIQAGKWSFLRTTDGKEIATIEYDIILDTQKKPTWIDLKRAGQPTPIVQGLIEVQGDTMKMLYGPGRTAGARPTTFESTDGRHILMTFKREK